MTNIVEQHDTLDRTDLAIDGMSCAACASRIEGALGNVPGVDDAHVNFATRRATVLHHGLPVDQLARAVEEIGYHAAADSDDAGASDDRAAERRGGRRVLVAAALALPVVALSMIDPLRFDGWRWVAGALATVVVFWAGAGFHRAAASGLRHGITTMDTLVSVGTIAAWGWSTAVLLSGADGHVYYETAAVIVVLILLGRWFEARARRRSGDALRRLSHLGAHSARLVDGTEIPADELVPGQRFTVRPGERIATDGVVVEGHAAVDASMVSGEPVPVDVGPGDEVTGATVATDGALVVEATRVGADTMLAQMVRLVEEAQGSRAEVQRLADRVAAVFVPVVIVAAIATWIVWAAGAGEPGDGLVAAIAVLIVACPCALGLATPLAIMVGTGRAAQLGIIVRGGEVLEDTRRVDTIVIDKTGTLTEARMVVVDTVAPDADATELRRLAASVEHQSEHPIARAIADGVADRAAATDFANHPGVGVTATVERRSVAVGRPSLFTCVPAPVAEAATAAEARGATTVLVGRDGTAEAVLAIADTVRPTATEAVELLGDLGMHVMLLTGDHQAAADAVATEVGIDDVIAGADPTTKLDVVRGLRADGRRVAMVGDGVNDAAALAEADLGIAIGSGTDIAREASDLTVVSSDLRAVADAIALSRRTLATIKGNLFWAFAYNVAALPLAAAGLLSPMIAAGAMSLSSLFVATNSLRLRRFRGSRS